MQHDIELVDPRGRTPLHLAVTLGRIKCVETLLAHKADSLAVNRHHWAGKQHQLDFHVATHIPS